MPPAAVQRALARARLSSKVAIAKAGRDSRRLDTIVNLPKIETWRREHVPAGTPAFTDRELMYDHLHAELIGDKAIDYLEFGVFEGRSVRHWADLNTNRDSRFFGFDSFEGLPEEWKRFDRSIAAAHFDLQGVVPEIDDERVSFVAGWFQESVDPFLETFTPRHQMVVHIDADLYSSALYVLTRFNALLTPGTIVIFDEFSSALNEFRALEDYCSAYMREYDVLAHAWHYFGQVAIQMR
ncbi:MULTISPECIES: TylF/MycF/NovP-related O-methyltransferase [unclassified Nocardioides]|jgi:O-methyltransferase|uniref:TylF/MycF/NovP-related O-methyltransferase n=1 Tax=unclassified Nocardioides TaxID=2615069 RepID=UPI000A65C9C1|nr:MULTISPECIES: class I SAM-dependent methyltransferase [unclassified Nocardioides]